MFQRKFPLFPAVLIDLFRLAEADRDRVRGGSFFGLSLLVVAAIMSHGHACGCIKAEMLAINDDGKSICAQTLYMLGRPENN